jgi:hypothetical protein
MTTRWPLVAAFACAAVAAYAASSPPPALGGPQLARFSDRQGRAAKSGVGL